MEQKLENKCEDMIQDLGLDFTCEECGTELTIQDDECSECNALAHWSTDCQVKDVRELLSENGYECK